MFLEIIGTLFWRITNEAYKVFAQYLISNILAFVKGFEIAIFVIVAAVFVLIAVGVSIRQARLLPKSYVIEIADLDGMQVSIDGLRQTFSTYEAAESYARFYRKMYEHQYRFKVIGSGERANYDKSRIY